jgi:hypothetical protein
MKIIISKKKVEEARKKSPTGIIKVHLQKMDRGFKKPAGRFGRFV